VKTKPLGAQSKRIVLYFDSHTSKGVTVNQLFPLGVLPLLIVGHPYDSSSSPIGAADALLQALVRGNSREVSEMVMTSSQFKSLYVGCSKDAWDEKKMNTWFNAERDRLTFLATVPRPLGLRSQITSFRIESSELQKAGSTDKLGCINSRDFQFVSVSFHYSMVTAQGEQPGCCGSGPATFIQYDGRYLIFEAPEMESFEALGVAAGLTVPPGGEKPLEDCIAEVPANVKAIKESEEIYNSENDGYLVVASHPTARAPGKKAQVWTTSSAEFNSLNWHPDGKVRGVYSVSTTPSSRTPGGDFTVTGRIDCDEDGREAVYTATKSLNTRRVTPDYVY
jgi:hypothetical protein